MQKNTLLFLHAQTPLHPGAGQSVDLIDLPVQRERHTGWPMIAGSGIKGVLRDFARSKLQNGSVPLGDLDKDPRVETVFGPALKGEEASKHAGAISQPEAALLFFPVRSLKGLFAWVTCPSALERFCRCADMVGNTNLKPDTSLLNPSTNLISTNSLLGISRNGSEEMVLEEYGFAVNKSDKLNEFATSLKKYLKGVDKLCERIALVDDDSFTTFTSHCMQYGMRNALDYETKTARDKALFYYEDMPAETILYTLMAIDEPRSKDPNNALKDSAAILEFLRQKENGLGLSEGQYIQFGGHATTGKGICRVTMV